LVFDSLLITIKKLYPNIKKEDIYIVIEHYSIGQNTNNLLQMVEYTHSFKKLLLDYFLLDNFYVTTAPEMKLLLANNGNADKFVMFESFLKEKLTNNDFHDFLITNKEKCYKSGIKKGKEIKIVESPIDDIIDSYILAKWLSLNLFKTS
jgi:hypothetical protein